MYSTNLILSKRKTSKPNVPKSIRTMSIESVANKHTHTHTRVYSPYTTSFLYSSRSRNFIKEINDNLINNQYNRISYVNKKSK